MSPELNSAVRIATGYDRLAEIYRTLELLAFGTYLERARFAHLEAVACCDPILLVGDGDGRYLERLLWQTRCLAPKIDVVERSERMIERSQRRLRDADRPRVTYHRTSLFEAELTPANYAALVNCFFLDQFEGENLERAIHRLAAWCRPGALLSISDFRIPDRGLARLYARLWLKFLYGFFGLVTGIDARRLEDPARCLTRRHFSPVETQLLLGGFLHSTLWRLGDESELSGRSGSA